jgi:hypothetical protein
MLVKPINLTRTKPSVICFSLCIVVFGLHLGSSKPAYGDQAVAAGCWDIHFLGKDNHDRYRYRVDYACRWRTEKKIAWVNAIDTDCITFRRNTSFWTSRRKSWRYFKSVPWVKGVKNC